MLNGLRPNGNDDEDIGADNGPEVVDAELLPQRPQFVLGPEVDDEQHQLDGGHRAVNDQVASNGKGWKEVA